MAGDSGGSAGPFSYQLNTPSAILFDPYGYMFILDAGNSRMQKWFPGATYGVTVLATTLASPLGMQMDPLGNLAIADTNYHRVQLFAVWCRKFDSFAPIESTSLFSACLEPTTTTTVQPPCKSIRSSHSHVSSFSSL